MNLSILGRAGVKWCAFIFLLLLRCSIAARELDADFERAFKPFRKSNLTAEERKSFSGVLFDLPDWEKRLAVIIAKLTVDARYDGAFDKRATEVNELQNKMTGGVELTASEKQRYSEYVKWSNEESQMVAKARNARDDLAYIINSLGETGDKRVIPLIAPLLSERSAYIDRFTDASVPPPQEIAWDAMMQAQRKGLVLPNIPKFSDDEALLKWVEEKAGGSSTVEDAGVRAMRKWWQENKALFSPVPAVLAEVELSAESVQLPKDKVSNSPAPDTTPSSSPESAETKTGTTVTHASNKSGWNLSIIWFAVPFVLLIAAVLLFRKKKF